MSHEFGVTQRRARFVAGGAVAGHSAAGAASGQTLVDEFLRGGAGGLPAVIGVPEFRLTDVVKSGFKVRKYSGSLSRPAHSPGEKNLPGEKT
jgi:hypothetical protein